MFITMRSHDTVAWLHDTKNAKGCIWTTSRDLATDFPDSEADGIVQALREEGRSHIYECRARLEPAPRPIADIVSDIENLRTAMADTTRRLRTVLAADTFTIDNLYREVAGMRSAAQSFTEIVDDMCRHCFPMPLAPIPKGILRFICENSPIPEDRLRERVRSAHPQRTDTGELIDRMIEAAYVRRLSTAGRDMLVATETGRAAQAGILWTAP